MTRLRAFQGAGVELEYMLVDAGSLDVAPAAPAVLARLAGDAGACDVARGLLGWSNELVAHVLELKNRAPVADLPALAEAFAAEVRWMNARLAEDGLRLMPSAMHAWMDPAAQTVLWPVDPAGIYAAYHRIFDCRGHGWANLQSAHLNLPFGDDAEFARLHGAVRLLLPLLPALAASSPYVEGRRAPWLDFRLLAYRDNAGALRSIPGQVVPEAVTDETDYRARILAPMYAEIAPYDPEGVLRYEWLNSRGAIARFDRHAIEIRVLDVQECPSADIAIARAVVTVLQALVEGRLGDVDRPVDTSRLAACLDAVAEAGERAPVEDADWQAALGVPPGALTAGAAWRALLEAVGHPVDAHLAVILREGPLARRMLSHAGDAPTPAALRALGQALCDCLEADRSLDAA